MVYAWHGGCCISGMERKAIAMNSVTGGYWTGHDFNGKWSDGIVWVPEHAWPIMRATWQNVLLLVVV